MITRKEYMADSNNLHQAYYLEVAQAAHLTANNLPVSVAKVREALKTDKNLNNIPLQLWDIRAHDIIPRLGPTLKARQGHGASLSDAVCALKALARHLAAEA